MTKKVNPQLFRLKKYNYINSNFSNFFDNINQYYLIKRNIYFFIKYFKKFKFFIFYFKLQRNFLNTFKIFFLGYFLKKDKIFFLHKKNFYIKKKKKKSIQLKKNINFKKVIKYLKSKNKKFIKYLEKKKIIKSIKKKKIIKKNKVLNIIIIDLIKLFKQIKSFKKIINKNIELNLAAQQIKKIKENINQSINLKDFELNLFKAGKLIKKIKLAIKDILLNIIIIDLFNLSKQIKSFKKKIKKNIELNLAAKQIKKIKENINQSINLKDFELNLFKAGKLINKIKKNLKKKNYILNRIKKIYLLNLKLNNKIQNLFFKFKKYNLKNTIKIKESLFLINFNNTLFEKSLFLKSKKNNNHIFKIKKKTLKKLSFLKTNKYFKFIRIFKFLKNNKKKIKKLKNCIKIVCSLANQYTNNLALIKYKFTLPLKKKKSKTFKSFYNNLNIKKLKKKIIILNYFYPNKNNNLIQFLKPLVNPKILYSIIKIIIKIKLYIYINSIYSSIKILNNIKNLKVYKVNHLYPKKKRYYKKYIWLKIKKKRFKFKFKKIKIKKKKLIHILKKFTKQRNKKYNIYKLHKLDLTRKKKNYKLKNFLNKVIYLKKKLILKWLLINASVILNTKFWNFFFKKSIQFFKLKYVNKNKPLFYNRFLNYKLKKFIKFKKSFWKFKLKKVFMFNVLKLNTFLLLQKNNMHIILYKKSIIKKQNNSKFTLNYLYKNKNLILYYYKYYKLFYKKKKNIKLKKKIFEKNISNILNKIFFPYIFKTFLKIKINNKKLNFFKYLFFNTYKHNFFKILNFLKKQYFLCFLYTIWYKDLNFLSFFFWSFFNKPSGNEKLIIKNIKSFLKPLLLLKYGILGIKIVLKGKLFKKPRKKKITFYKGSIQLLKINNHIKFLSYDVFKRAGVFNFKCWISFIK